MDSEEKGPRHRWIILGKAFRRPLEVCRRRNTDAGLGNAGFGIRYAMSCSTKVAEAVMARCKRARSPFTMSVVEGVDGRRSRPGWA
jgi:hypothetical protein